MTIRIFLIGQCSGWQVLMVPVTGFPVPPEERAAVLGFITRLSDTVVKAVQLSREVFIQMTYLHFPTGSSQLFSKHAREWVPAMGLGVWPDRDPPTIWSAKDFENLVPGQAPRTLIDQVFRMTKSEDAKISARDTMFGYGAVLEVLTEDTGEKFLDRCRSALFPPINDPTYTCFPFYVPLLESKSFANAPDAEIISRTCGASAYFRESVEDNGVLIATAIPLLPILENMGARSVGSGIGEWILDSNKR